MLISFSPSLSIPLSLSLYLSLLVFYHYLSLYLTLSLSKLLSLSIYIAPSLFLSILLYLFLSLTLPHISFTLLFCFSSPLSPLFSFVLLSSVLSPTFCFSYHHFSWIWSKRETEKFCTKISQCEHTVQSSQIRVATHPKPQVCQQAALVVRICRDFFTHSYNRCTHV